MSALWLRLQLWIRQGLLMAWIAVVLTVLNAGIYAALFSFGLHSDGEGTAQPHGYSGVAVAAPSDAGNFRRFRAVLGMADGEAKAVAMLFSAAAQGGLQLQEAAYERRDEQEYSRFEVTLPLKGRYEDIRNFCERVLLAAPHAALDNLSFRRDAIGSDVVEANLHFTFFLRPLSPRRAS